jgi:DNA repair protein RadA/Sms
MASSKRRKSSFVCSECGFSSPKWLGRCPECGSWDSLVEERPVVQDAGGGLGSGPWPDAGGAVSYEALAITGVETRVHSPLSTGIGEFDRVLGGGLVPGAMILLAGAPGIGKSTLLMQALLSLAAKGAKVLYVSGEESASQIAIRARRLGQLSDNLLLLCESDVRAVVSALYEIRPQVLAVDSIQTMRLDSLPGVPGSMSQVRHSSAMIMDVVKGLQIPAILVGHVTKQGGIAGPMVLEHMVDAVLSFEGDRTHAYRILRAVKNRYGSISEIGIFEMTGAGLVEVGEPSELFLNRRPEQIPGSVITVCMEGSRPILLEIQALVNRSYLAMPRRTTAGIDSNRLALLTAVAERHLGLTLFDKDIFLNVAGGFRVGEPAADLPIVMAVCSSLLSRPVGSRLAIFGEVGLTGEVRPVPHLEQRISEAARLGFNGCMVPAGALKRGRGPLANGYGGVELVPVSSISEAKSYIDGKG